VYAGASGGGAAIAACWRWGAGGMMEKRSRMCTCRHCVLQIPALIPLCDHPHRVFTALLIEHLHPEQAALVPAPPKRQDELLPLLLKQAFDGAEGVDPAKAE
jgi:hypothetical protein